MTAKNWKQKKEAVDMTKITNYMLKYLLTAYDDADPVTRFIWRLRVRLMTDKEIRETYYQLTDR